MSAMNKICSNSLSALPSCHAADLFEVYYFH